MSTTTHSTRHISELLGVSLNLSRNEKNIPVLLMKKQLGSDADLLTVEDIDQLAEWFRVLHTTMLTMKDTNQS